MALERDPPGAAGARARRSEHPEANVAHLDLKWWLLAQFDSALVSSADGTSASWYKRDPEMFRDLRQALGRAARAARQGVAGAGRSSYKDALPELASPKTWADDVRRRPSGSRSRSIATLPADAPPVTVPPDTVAALRDALTAADFTVDGVAALIGSARACGAGTQRDDAGAAAHDRRLSPRDADPALAAAGAGARSADVEQALPGLVDQLCRGRSAASTRSARCARSSTCGRTPTTSRRLVGRVRPDSRPRRARAPDAGPTTCSASRRPRPAWLS